MNLLRNVNEWWFPHNYPKQRYKVDISDYILSGGISANSSSGSDIWIMVNTENKEVYIIKLYDYEVEDLNNKLYTYEDKVYQVVQDNYYNSPLFVKYKGYDRKTVGELSIILFNYYISLLPQKILDLYKKIYKINDSDVAVKKDKNLFEFIFKVSKINVYFNHKYMVDPSSRRRDSIIEINDSKIQSTIRDIDKIFDDVKNKKCGAIVTYYQQGLSLKKLSVDISDLTPTLTSLFFAVYKLASIGINHNDLHFGNILTKKNNYKNLYLIHKTKIYKLELRDIICLYDYDRATMKSDPNNTLNVFVKQNRVGYPVYNFSKDFLKTLCIVLTNIKMDRFLKDTWYYHITDPKLRKIIMENKFTDCKLEPRLYNTNLLDEQMDSESILESFLDRNESVKLDLIKSSDHPWILDIASQLIKNKKSISIDKSDFYDLVDSTDKKKLEYIKSLVEQTYK